MKVLLIHNRYQQAGGEDTVFSAEVDLLRRRGHDVVVYVEDNARIDEIGRLATAVRTVWSTGTRARLRDLIRRERPQVAHFHNTFPLISPSAYWACRETATPVVQTLHNYRLLCANSLLFRSGHPCEDCMGTRLLWPGVVHACYRGSRLETAGVTMMLDVHRMLGTWRNKVDLYIALTEFSREKFIEGGIEGERIAVKPNFVHPDPGPGSADGDFALFVGRLSAEKGIRVLLDAWRTLPELPLRICGDGPMRELVDRRAASPSHPRVQVLRRLSRQRLFDAMKQARFLVFPSTCYENFPMVIAEAFACGVPVLSTDVGAGADIIEEGRTGAHFRSGDAHSLAAAARRLWARPSDTRAMGGQARAEFMAKYTAEASYVRLMDLYSRARNGGGAQG